MRSDCDTCAVQVGRRRARSIVDRFDAAPGPGGYVLETVLTVPPESRDRMADRKVWRKAVRKMWAVLHREFGGAYGVECTHPTGDEGVNGETEFHPHANFLWIQRPGFRAVLDLEKLKARWRAILGCPRDPVVYHRFTHKAGSIAHLARYVARAWPGWKHWLGSVRWYGAYPRRVEKPEVRCLTCDQKLEFVRESDDREYRSFQRDPALFLPLWPDN